MSRIGSCVVGHDAKYCGKEERGVGNTTDGDDPSNGDSPPLLTYIPLDELDRVANLLSLSACIPRFISRASFCL